MVSAASKSFVSIIEDRIQDRSVVVSVLDQESTIWKDLNMKAFSRHWQLIYIDIGGLRAVSNNRCDKVENLVMDGAKIGKSRNVGNNKNSEGVVADGVRTEEFGKSWKNL